MHRERNERFQTSLRDFPDTAARSQDWRPGLFSRRPSGTSPTPPRDPRTGVLGYFQGVPPGLPRHRREIPGLASWAIFKASLRDFPDTAARSQDWRPGLFSRRPYGTSCRTPSHSTNLKMYKLLGQAVQPVRPRTCRGFGKERLDSLSYVSRPKDFPCAFRAGEYRQEPGTLNLSKRIVKKSQYRKESRFIPFFFRYLRVSAPSAEKSHDPQMTQIHADGKQGMDVQARRFQTRILRSELSKISLIGEISSSSRRRGSQVRLP